MWSSGSSEKLWPTLTTCPGPSDIREQYSQWCLTDLLLLTCSFRQEIRPWGGTETLLGWGEGEVLQLDLRWGKLTGKKECQQIVVATSGHQVKAQNLTWRESSQRAIHHQRKVDKVAPYPPFQMVCPLHFLSFSIQCLVFILTYFPCSMCCLFLLCFKWGWCLVYSLAHLRQSSTLRVKTNSMTQNKSSKNKNKNSIT